MRTITLSTGHLVLLDERDYDLANSYDWLYSDGYVITREGLSLHNLIMNPPAGFEVDHVDRSPLNNQRNNLRHCTHAQNCYNRPKQKNNSSGYKGVFAVSGFSNRWVARIIVKKKAFYSSVCDTPQKAAVEYNRLAIKHAGEFAYLNPV